MPDDPERYQITALASKIYRSLVLEDVPRDAITNKALRLCARLYSEETRRMDITQVSKLIHMELDFIQADHD